MPQNEFKTLVVLPSKNMTIIDSLDLTVCGAIYRNFGFLAIAWGVEACWRGTGHVIMPFPTFRVQDIGPGTQCMPIRRI